jgi:hypothetical protein
VSEGTNSATVKAEANANAEFNTPTGSEQVDAPSTTEPDVVDSTDARIAKDAEAQAPSNPDDNGSNSGSGSNGGNGNGGNVGNGEPSASAQQVTDDTVIVRGGTRDLPSAGEVGSATQGSTLDEAAAGVPHGQVRVTTAGDIRAGGGTVEYAPEFDPNVGRINYQHVDFTLGDGSNPFSDLMPNPIPKSGRFGGPNYPYREWEP